MPPGLKLKLSTGAGKSPAPNGTTSQPPPPATPATPSIRFKLGASQTTPAIAPQPPPPKPPKSSSKKRPRDETDDNPADSPPKKRASGGPVIKIAVGKKSTPAQVLNEDSLPPITPQTATATRFKIKAKGKPLARPLGVGYDSEAEDAEEDPAIEENVILRMSAGEDCDYLRHAIETRTIGIHPSQGGADIHMRFFRYRRAVIVIRSVPYAAVLVDLPCIVESMKSWDKRGWWKSADICQMLYVFGRVASEQAAESAPLPRDIDTNTWQWPHGLTPPMHNVRKRRFRKRVSYRTIEAAEDEVERLLSLDVEAERGNGTTIAEIVDLDRLRNQDMESDDVEDEYCEEADEEQYYEDDEEEEDPEALAARIALELGAADDADDVVNDESLPATAVLQESEATAAPTSAAQESVTSPEQPESASESEEDEVEEEQADEEDVERAQMLAQQREEVEHLQRQIDGFKTDRDAATNPLLKARWQKRVDALEMDLASKKRSIGDDADDE